MHAFGLNANYFEPCLPIHEHSSHCSFGLRIRISDVIAADKCVWQCLSVVQSASTKRVCALCFSGRQAARMEKHSFTISSLAAAAGCQCDESLARNEWRTSINTSYEDECDMYQTWRQAEQQTWTTAACSRPKWECVTVCSRHKIVWRAIDTFVFLIDESYHIFFTHASFDPKMRLIPVNFSHGFGARREYSYSYGYERFRAYPTNERV